jgi:hypothetical protein
MNVSKFWSSRRGVLRQSNSISTPQNPAPRVSFFLQKRFIAFMLALILPSSFAVSTFQTTNLTIKYHDPKDKAQLELVIQTWKDTQTKLRAIGLEPQAVTLEAYASAAQFSKATGEPWFVAAVTQGKHIQTQRLGALKTRGILKFTIFHEAFHTVQPAG